MTETTAAGAAINPIAEHALAVCVFVETRIEDEIAREAHRYHHDSCGSLGFALHDCDCDGPERTRETLRTVLGAVKLCQTQIEQDGTLCEDVRSILRVLVAPYRRRADFPQWI